MTPSIVNLILRTAESHGARGEYGAAASLLDLLPVEANAVGAGLLRAKLLAQQGLFEQAIAEWEAVKQVVPEHPDAIRGIAAAKRQMRRPAFLVRFRQYLLPMGAAAFVLALVWNYVQPSPPDPAVEALRLEIVQVGQRQQASEQQTLQAIQNLDLRLKTIDETQRAAAEAAERQAARLRRQILTLQRRVEQSLPPNPSR